jgi:hypothetical protein
VIKQGYKVNVRKHAKSFVLAWKVLNRHGKIPARVGKQLTIFFEAPADVQA